MGASDFSGLAAYPTISPNDQRAHLRLCTGRSGVAAERHFQLPLGGSVLS